MKNINKSARVCVTGGGGFLGRAVMSALSAHGFTNHVAVRQRDYNLVRGEDVERLYRDIEPQIVIHLAAAVGGIGANRENPGKYFYDNLMMGAQLIEGARVNRVEKFVQIGTICSYPNLTPVPFKEEDLWHGYPEVTNAPYGIAKKALLVQCQAYREQYGLNSIYLLPVNLYGPHDNFSPATSHVLPALIKKFVDAVESGAPTVEVWGTGTATREFLYVDDAAEGIVLATEKYDGSEPVNLGSGKETSIKELAEMLAQETGFNGEVVWDVTKPDGQPRRLLDTTRAAELFGFRAQTDFLQGLRQTIEWYCTQRPEMKASLVGK